LIAVTILNMSAFMMVIGFIVPFIAEDRDSGFGLDGLSTALLFITPAALAQLITAPLAGRLAVRIGFVTLLRVGQIAGVVLVVLVATLWQERVVLAVLMALLGFTYMGMAGTAMGILGVVQAPDDEPGSLPGLSNAAYGIGSSIGFAWAGPLVGSGTVGSFTTSLWICAGMGVVGLALTLILRPRAVTAPVGGATLPLRH
jgi:predicted MFS family arabinose efflux permease